MVSMGIIIMHKLLGKYGEANKKKCMKKFTWNFLIENTIFVWIGTY